MNESTTVGACITIPQPLMQHWLFWLLLGFVLGWLFWVLMITIKGGKR
jgi:hypothetical protein